MERKNSQWVFILCLWNFFLTVCLFPILFAVDSDNLIATINVIYHISIKTQPGSEVGYNSTL